MDSLDEQDLYREWKKFDSKLIAYYEKEAWKFLPKLDKLVKEKLGWRRRFPEDDYDRFTHFMYFVENVYLRPSLSDDCTDFSWDSDSSTGETLE